jgi:hypothetical protein
MLEGNGDPVDDALPSKRPMMPAPFITIVIMYIFRKEEEGSMYNEVQSERVMWNN